MLLYPIGFISMAKAQAEIPIDIKNALISGNSQQLAKFFSKNVELFINQKEDVYSKAQAELILKDFFSKHSPNDFLIEFDGTTDGTKYTIGNLITSNGKFRIYISYRNNPGRQYINRMNITEIN